MGAPKDGRKISSVITGPEPSSTQRDLRPDIVAELDVADLADAQEIGRGGFGVVYKCVQRSLDRTVAVKVLSADLDQENRDRFLREEHAMGRLSGHPNIVDILQVDVTMTGRPYIVMPFHARGSLEALLRESGPLPWAEVVRIGIKVAGALEWAHRAGILHRDVKPANILLTAYDEPQLTDFGIARVPGGFETSTNAIAGSPAFTAPEVLQGHEPTVRSDVYGLGATLFCLVTGHAAFERKSGEKVVAQFLRITSEPIPDLRELDLPVDFVAAIEAAMSADPSKRPATAAEFGQMLQLVEDEHGLRHDEMALPTDRPRPVPATVAQGPLKSAQASLPRSRLLEILKAGGGRQLTAIHAPAGSGKTALLLQWRDVLIHDGIAVAWLSVDGDDNNAVWFVTHMIDAIRRVRPDLAADATERLEEQGDDALRAVLTALIEQIHTSGETLALVIDDWHRVTDRDSIAALEFLLDHGCHHLRIVVASRSRTGLPLARFRVRDELVEIDSDAIRFDLDETKQFLVDARGLDLSDADIEALWAATEGWVAALQLFALAVRGSGTTTRSIGRSADEISRMSGSHSAIGEYLIENVLHTLEPEMIEFLMAASVAERINSGLAAAMSDDENARALLDDAVHRGLFLQRTEDPDWFRFQLLFADFLRQRLERAHPGRVRSLHLRASRWFAEHGMLRESVDHAMAAADPKFALDLIESTGMDIMETSRMNALLAMVTKGPVQQVTSKSKGLFAAALNKVNSALGASDDNKGRDQS
ncbi:serine/threonine-protein kinase [Antrihabitans stalactiti]|uniref:non-specific serine/threonine protein kinase n=1 Tax=Antrihabitans stalactiti TaxID=2584121 RepID=A0A848KFK9_9NOCA|nr:serine/threonine-protein kinase [Antrihabitans stalactiti]NMN94990.1 serine/threonine-protein kinase PknK [Antrihabitans stalactiti]